MTNTVSIGVATSFRDKIQRLVSGIQGPDADAGQDLASYRLLVDSLFSSPASIFISNIVGVMVPFFCLSATGETMFLWLGILAAVVVALRAVTVTRYLRADRSNADMAEVKAWDREYFLG